ncbi:MAG: peptidoglycan-binding protein [Actinobacteria bacterium]|nr:peptidoglycan-binding protein [Actinomycetota bacterium]
MGNRHRGSHRGLRSIAAPVQRMRGTELGDPQRRRTGGPGSPSATALTALPAARTRPLLMSPTDVLALQRIAGNKAVAGKLATTPRTTGTAATVQHNAPAGPAFVAQRLTEAQRRENLVSPRYAGNSRLQAAFDNNKAIEFAEKDHDAVRLVQQGLVSDGFPLPKSTRPNGELDGIYGGETAGAVTAFQRKHSLPSKDGKTGRRRPAPDRDRTLPRGLTAPELQRWVEVTVA